MRKIAALFDVKRRFMVVSIVFLGKRMTETSSLRLAIGSAQSIHGRSSDHIYSNCQDASGIYSIEINSLVLYSTRQSSTKDLVFRNYSLEASSRSSGLRCKIFWRAWVTSTLRHVDSSLWIFSARHCEAYNARLPFIMARDWGATSEHSRLPHETAFSGKSKVSLQGMRVVLFCIK